VDVIVQRRYMPHQLRSVLVREVFQYNVTEYPKYMGTEYNAAFSPFGLIRPPPGRNYSNTDPVDKAIGYLLDVELQLAAWKAAYPPTAPDTDRDTPRAAAPPAAAPAQATSFNGEPYEVRPGPLPVRYHHTMLEDVSTEAGAARFLLEQLGLPSVDATCVRSLLRDPPANPHAWLFKPLQDVPEVVWRARIQQFLEEYAAAGIRLPRLPQMDRVVPCANATGGEAAAKEAHTLDASKDNRIREAGAQMCVLPFKPFTAKELHALLFNVTIPMRPLTRRYIGAWRGAGGCGLWGAGGEVIKSAALHGQSWKSAALAKGCSARALAHSV